MIWLGLVALLLLAAVWTAALLLSWHLWIPVLVSVAVLMLLGLVFGLRWLRSKRKAAEIDAQVRRQKRSSDSSASADAEVVLELQGRLRELAAALRRGAFSKSLGDSALYDIPWYLILGPPGSGKSTALDASGLPLSLAGGRAPKSRRQGPTKGWEPWLSEEGVLIDTAGAYSAGDAEQESSALLATLRRARRKRPLDGVVVTYSLSDLASDRPEQLDEKAKRLRAHLEDIGSKLGTVLPVYLLLTKADLLPGFADFYADLPMEAAQRVWGATIDSARHLDEEPVASFKAEFDLLKSVLHAYLVSRLSTHKRTADGTAKALRFPVEFEAVRAPLARLVEELFRPSSYQEAPVLRGFYFCSSGGTDAREVPVERHATQFLAHTNLSPVAAPNSTFLSDFFPRVLFPDRHFATRSRRRRLLDRRQELLIWGAAGALLLFGALPPIASCVSNLSLIDATVDDAQTSRRMSSAAANQAGNGAAVALDLLVERYLKLQAEAERFNVSYWWGPYSAAPLRDALRFRYLDLLRATAEGPLRNRLVDSIRAASDERGQDPTGFESSYRDLELYLMLAHPDRVNREFAAGALGKLWSRVSGLQQDAGSSAIDAHVRNYLDMLTQDPSWAWAEDGILVTRARAQLSSMPIEEIKYAALEQAAAGAPPVLPEHIFVGEAARYVTTHGKVEVPGLYTALGWQKVQPLLKPDQSVDFAPWVLAERAADAPPWGVEQMRKLYFDRYVRAWMDFLVGLDVATPADLGAAIEELAALGKGEGPYVRLFRKLAENVRLELEAPSLKDQALAKVAQVASQVVPGGQPAPPPPERRVSPVEQYFRRMVRFGFGDAAPAPGTEMPPSLLTQYLDQLRALEVSLRQLQDTGAEASTEFAAELERASSSVERLLAGFDQTERLALEPLLLNPIRGSQRIVEAKGRAALTDRWRIEVWEPYRRLVTHYPFVLKSASDVALPDFSEFFRPQTGTFWRFYQETLANRFMRSGPRYVPRPSEAKSGFRSDFLDCLSVAQEIGDAVFVDGATQPAVPFKVKMQSVDARVSEITLNIDGDTLAYRNEPEKWRAMQWPGKNGPAGASLQVKGSDFNVLVERDDGEFGFFRLLSAGDIKPISPGALTLEATWRFRLNKAESRVTIQFQVSRQRYPFLPGFFSRLNCPSSIMDTSVDTSPARRSR